MAAMMESMIQAVVERMLAEQYPHSTLPPVMYARVVSAAQQKETEREEILLVEEGGAESRRCILRHWYKYTLKILDPFGAENPDYPPIPGVYSLGRYRQGAVVAVGLAGGEIAPAIIGEVLL